jgi:hypothetical protein
MPRGQPREQETTPSLISRYPQPGLPSGHTGGAGRHVVRLRVIVLGSVRAATERSRNQRTCYGVGHIGLESEGENGRRKAEGGGERAMAEATFARLV